MAELDTAQVAELLEQLLEAGWQTAQLRHRVGPALGGEQPTAALLVERLRALAGRSAGDGERRTRPSCTLCAGESAIPVTDDVHLCRRCVAVMASGRARLSDTG
jgi:hypothetical protein